MDKVAEGNNRSAGLFLVLEGADGSGKSTQFRLLYERLKAAGYDVAIFKFPQYGQPSSYFVERYLNGHYGSANTINPYSASLFYALDRFEAASKIREELGVGKIVLADRYVGSNMAHQGSKLTNPVDQRSFFVWEDNLEFYLLKIPRPDLNIFLRVPPEISIKLMGQENRSDRIYTNKSHDEHEKDAQHLQKTVTTYDLLCQLFPKDFLAIECTENGQLMPIPDVSDLIWKAVKPMLPQPTRPGKKVIVKLPKTSLKRLLKDHHTTKKNGSKTTNPLLTLKIEKISLLAIEAMKLEPELSIEIEKAWGEGESNYGYYIPSNLPLKIKNSYSLSIDKLVNLYKQAKSTLETLEKNDKSKLQLLDNIRPLSASYTINLKGPLEALHSLVLRLAVSNLVELRALSERLKQELINRESGLPKKSTALDNAQPQSLNEILEKIARERESDLSRSLSSHGESEHLQLLEVWPRNELDLLIDGLYPLSNSSRTEIAARLDNWTYEQKSEALTAALIQPGSQLLKQVHYHFDTILDRATLEELGNALTLENLQLQPATPRYGYDLPQPLEANLEEILMEAYDVSLEFFSHLQEEGQEDKAEYAALWGHKVRCQFVVNCELLKQQIESTASSSPSLQTMMESMIEKISEVHFLIGAFLLKAEQRAKVTLNKPLKKTSKVVRAKRRRRSTAK